MRAFTAPASSHEQHNSGFEAQLKDLPIFARKCVYYSTPGAVSVPSISDVPEPRRGKRNVDIRMACSARFLPFKS